MPLSTHDTIGTIPGTTKIGNGAAIRIKDGGMMANPQLVEFMCRIGRKNNIKHYKFISMGGGTDVLLNYNMLKVVPLL
nr:hypothetical protein [Mycoplasmopsis bovis]